MFIAHDQKNQLFIIILTNGILNAQFIEEFIAAAVYGIPKAKLAFEGKGEYVPGPWCVFCKAAVKCRARAEEKLALARYEFAQPPLLTDAEIEEILGKLDDLTRWAEEIKAYAQDAALNHGKQWHGFKVVEGRSVRKYSKAPMS